jgi:hypothetical protein
MAFVQTDSITLCTKGSTHIKLSSHLGSKVAGQGSPTLTVTTFPLKDTLALDFVCLVSNPVDN